jgi:hypothetical protein
MSDLQILHIKKIGSTGDWSPLFAKLKGWSFVNGEYTDGHHTFVPSEEAYFELQANSQATFDNLKALPNTKEVGENQLVTKSLGGIKVLIEYIEEKTKASSPYMLNHIALSVESIDKEAKWWKDLFQCKEVLRVNQGFDPIVNGPFNTLHMYKEGELYVTLREQKPDGAIHHLGFEMKNENLIDEVHKILKEISWPIFWEGMIDESYVIHFIGPDKRIHDFFCPNAHLKSVAKK